MKTFSWVDNSYRAKLIQIQIKPKQKKRPNLHPGALAPGQTHPSQMKYVTDAGWH